LIEWLNRFIPAKAPSPDTPVNQIFYDAGKRSLVETLIALQAQQEDEASVS
jgi:hypothetical protein